MMDSHASTTLSVALTQNTSRVMTFWMLMNLSLSALPCTSTAF